MTYHIDCVLAEKFAPDGNILRLPSRHQIYLNSDVGVQRYIDEQKPFKSVVITKFGEDVTEEFEV